MKTLKQLRENYEDRYVPQTEGFEEIVLESKSKSLTRSDVPAPSRMPAMLLFRRVSYRLFPNDQVVALYYSKMVDKYLSVPFGPDGNLNLSESSVYDTIEELDLSEGAKWDAVKGGLKGAAHGVVRGAAIGNVVAPGPGTVIGAAIGGARGAYKGAKAGLEKSKEQSVKESFKKRLEEKRQEKLDEFWPLIASLAGTAISGITDAIKGTANKSVAQSQQASTQLMRDKPGKKSKSSWKDSSDPVTASRLKSADLAQSKSVTTPQQKQIKENKMIDLRKMVTEDIAEKDITINGRTIKLNTGMAKRILEVYDSVNTKNKKIVEGMLNEDLESFKKLLNFVVRK